VSAGKTFGGYGFGGDKVYSSGDAHARKFKQSVRLLNAASQGMSMMREDVVLPTITSGTRLMLLQCHRTVQNPFSLRVFLLGL
jgi:hypothetical protein